MKRLTKEEFIEKARKLYGYKYDYSLVEYKSTRQDIKIICPKHGIFIQKAGGHLKGRGCELCGIEKRTRDRTYTLDDFIRKAKEIHGDRYDYSLVKYNGSGNYVDIICPIHGVFTQLACNHLNGHGCNKCFGNWGKDNEWFIENAKNIHGNKYDYSLVKYNGSWCRVDIICPVHGVFKQIAHNHIRGQGCPYCNEYSTEKDVEKILQKENIISIREKTFDWLMYRIKMRIDFYIPRYNVAIECQGIQHFEPVEKFGGVDGYLETIDRDNKKRELCEQHGIKVFYYANYQYDFPYKVYTDPEELIAEIKKIDPVNNS